MDVVGWLSVFLLAVLVYFAFLVFTAESGVEEHYFVVNGTGQTQKCVKTNDSWACDKYPIYIGVNG